MRAPIHNGGSVSVGTDSLRGDKILFTIPTNSLVLEKRKLRHISKATLVVSANTMKTGMCPVMLLVPLWTKYFLNKLIQIL